MPHWECLQKSCKIKRENEAKEVSKNYAIKKITNVLKKEEKDFVTPQATPVYGLNNFTHFAQSCRQSCTVAIDNFPFRYYIIPHRFGLFSLFL